MNPNALILADARTGSTPAGLPAAGPNDPGYRLATGFNTAVISRPRTVIAAAGVADIVATVRFAAGHGLRVAVRCTGHGATAGIDDDVLLVHTGAMDQLQIDPGTRRARIGAGLTWRPVIEAAAAYGLTPIVGSAPDVGVVGFLTGGGIGPLVRRFGLSSDWVSAFELVTGTGELLRVTPDHHPELFWGLRGGKATLGIVAAVEIELVAAERFYGGALYYDGADASAVVHAWGAVSRELSPEVDTSLALLQLPALPAVPPPLAGRMTVAVRCASVDGARACEPLLGALRERAEPLLDTVAERPFTEIGFVHADPTDPAPVAMSSALLHDLPDPAVDALLQSAGPGSESPQVLCELRRLGGAYRRGRNGRDAFAHRGAAYNLAVIGRDTAETGAHVTHHAAGVLAALEPWSTGGVQPNFSATAGRDAATRCYDPATRVRLSALADRYDPNGVLAVGQVVRGF